jgi:hypothetical protein
MKAARGRARTPKHFVRNLRETPLLFAKLLECDASSHRFCALASTSGRDPAQIAFGGSRNGCFCVCENVRLPPAAINLLE